MRLSSNLLLRVEPTLPVVLTQAARSLGICRSEFVRRAVAQALASGLPDQVRSDPLHSRDRYAPAATMRTAA